MSDDKKTENVKEVTKKEEKTETKVSKGVEKLVDEIAKLSVMELSELVNALQDKLGVSAAMPMAAAVAAAPAGEAPAGDAGQGGGSATQTVIMTGSGGNKIAVIKALREINQNLSLMDAKGMTENVPAEILKDAKAEDAKSAVEKLKAAGATVEVK
jgi:large subunit ribosomal protein L7/L12